MSLPPIRFIQPGPMAPQASMSAATAPGRGAMAIGQAVEGVGHDLLKVAGQVREVKDQGGMVELFAGFDQESARFMLETAGRGYEGDPLAEWRGKSGEFSSAIDQSDLSPVAKAEAKQRLVDWNSDRSIMLQKQIFLKDVEVAKTQFTSGVSYYRSRGEFDKAAEVIHSAPGSVMNSAERDAALRDNDVAAFQYGLQEKAQSDPDGTLKELEDPDFLKKNPGATVTGVEQAKDEARRQKRMIAYDATDRFENMVADGTLNRAEQVDTVFANASPALKAEFRAKLTALPDAQRKAYLETDTGQNELLGNVEAALDAYTPDVGDYDVQEFRIRELMHDLKPGSAKDAAQARLKQAKEGRVGEWKARQDPYRHQLQEIYKGGGFGLGTKQVPLKQLLDDGILRDKEKLMARGLSNAQAEMIASGKASKSDLEKIGITGAAARDYEPEEGDAGRVTLFRLLDDKRPGFESENADPFARAALDQISKPTGEGVIEWPDPEKTRETQRKYGAAKRELEKWWALKPDATEAEWDEKFRSVIGPDGERVNREGFFPSEGVLPPIPE